MKKLKIFCNFVLFTLLFGFGVYPSIKYYNIPRILVFLAHPIVCVIIPLIILQLLIMLNFDFLYERISKDNNDKGKYKNVKSTTYLLIVIGILVCEFVAWLVF